MRHNALLFSKSARLSEILDASRFIDRLAAMLDLLSDILTRLSLRGTLYFRTSFTEPWGVKVPAFSNVARFHYVHRGECVVRVEDGGGEARLAQGDLVLVPHGRGHSLTCRHSGSDQALPLDDVLERSGFDGSGTLVYGGPEPALETQLICGHFAIAPGSRHVLFDRLPPLIRIPDYGAEAGGWLEATLRVIGAEAGGARLGGDLIALKMSEAIFVQALRHYIETAKSSEHRLSGFGDPHLAKALEAFHRAPAEPWTVASMAREAGMSRTAFAQTFSGKLGLTPIQYVTGWRMQLAREALAGQRVAVAEAAELAGYASEAAFSRAFKKEVGLPPAAFRQQAVDPPPLPA